MGEMEIEGGEQVADFLVACPEREWLHLPGVGWLTVKRYQPYQGPSALTAAPDPAAAKHLPFFTVDPEMARALNGLEPLGKSFRDERARFVHALHPHSPAARRTERVAVRRPPWVDPIGDAICRRLLEAGSAELAGLGTFTVQEKPARPGQNPEHGEAILIPARRFLRFSASQPLKQRLAERP
jgi:nucleoid DNA-binding protein